MPSPRLAWRGKGLPSFLSCVCLPRPPPAQTPSDVFLLISTDRLRSVLVSVFGFQGAALPAVLSRGRPWRLRDSNSRPPACKAGALPAELSPRRTPADPFPARDLPSPRCLFFSCSGSRLLSRTVSGAVPSAVRAFTGVFGMGTCVSPGRIATRIFLPLNGICPPDSNLSLGQKFVPWTNGQ